MPILLLEGAVTAGRTYHAYKRDGYVEARERFTEEAIGAVIWLWGVQFFNKIGDFIGKKFLKMPVVNFDVGQDKLRNPIEQVAKETNISKNKLAAFKFSKIAGAIFAATGFVGFVVPKINQAITRKVMDKQQNKQSQFTFHSGSYNDNAIKDFALNGQRNDNIRFKGTAESLGKFAYKLENDAVYRLLGSDAGLITGRAVNARNEHDRREILIRDIGSLYFYMWSSKHVMALLNKMSGKHSTLNKLEPMNALNLHNHLISKMNGKNYTPEEFKKWAIGEVKMPKNVEEFLNKSDEVIKLNDLAKLIDSKKLLKKADKMTELQPKINGEKVLTKNQVKDVFSTGWISSPEFLKKVYNTEFNGQIENPHKFISQKSVENLRTKISDFTSAICDYAKDKGKNIDDSLLETINKSNLRKYSLFYGIGFAVSTFFLSTGIPKFQYYVTKQITGQDKFPGIAEYNK